MRPVACFTRPSGRPSPLFGPGSSRSSSSSFSSLHHHHTTSQTNILNLSRQVPISLSSLFVEADVFLCAWHARRWLEVGVADRTIPPDPHARLEFMGKPHSRARPCAGDKFLERAVGAIQSMKRVTERYQTGSLQPGRHHIPPAFTVLTRSGPDIELCTNVRSHPAYVGKRLHA